MPPVRPLGLDAEVPATSSAVHKAPSPFTPAQPPLMRKAGGWRRMMLHMQALLGTVDTRVARHPLPSEALQHRPATGRGT